MEFVSLITALGKMLSSYGPSALGWTVSVVLGWYMLKQKKDESKEVHDAQTKLLEAKDSYIDKIQEMNDRLVSLGERHAEMLSHVSEQRLEDLKELTAEYNHLATNMIATLDKLQIALEIQSKYEKN